jgi:hypothetical protein
LAAFTLDQEGRTKDLKEDGGWRESSHTEFR